MILYDNGKVSIVGKKPKKAAKAKAHDISPAFPKHISLDGGRRWTRKESGVPGYSSDDCCFDILQGNGYVVLVASNDDGYEFWRKRFDTVLVAMEYAERM